MINSGDLVDLAHTPHVAEDEGGWSYYGYGVVVQETSNASPLIWHNGGSGDFSSEWNELLDYDLIVFIAGHQSEGETAYSAMELLREILGSKGSY